MFIFILSRFVVPLFLRTRPIQTHMARSQCCGYRKLYVAPGRTTKSLSLSIFPLSLHCVVRLVVPSLHHPGSDCDISLSIFMCLLKPSCPRFFAPGRTAKISLSPLFFKSRRALVSSPLVEPRNMSLSLPIPFSRLVVSSSLRPGLDCEMSLSLFFVLLAVRSAVSAVAKGVGHWAVAGHAWVLRHARGKGPAACPRPWPAPPPPRGSPSDLVVRVAHGVAPLGLVEARRKRWHDQRA